MIWLAVGGCLLVSFVFSGIEAGILSVNRVRLKHRLKMGDSAARTLDRLLARRGRILVTVLLVTNLMNIFAITLATGGLTQHVGPRGYIITGLIALPIYLFGVELLPKALCRVETFGVDVDATWRASGVTPGRRGWAFQLAREGRDLGAFDGMTGAGIREEYPDEAKRRQHTGKLYYRPPGGESWCDVALRVRSVLDTTRLDHDGARLWVFTHQAVIMAFRYVLESLSEQALLEEDGRTPLGNCSLTVYRPDEAGALALVTYGAVDHLEASDAEPTHEEPLGTRSPSAAGERS